MTLSTRAIVAAIISAYAPIADAALAAVCPGNGEMCFRWGVPVGASSGGSSNVYFQLRAPTSYAWFALGTGSSMRGSSMFVVYRNGENVTLSTRKGQGHSMPQYESRTDIQLLPGSGIVGRNLVANVLCTGCSDIDVSASSRWISAGQTGQAVDSASPTAPISYHDERVAFSVNLKQATVTSDSNPFLAPSTDGGTKPETGGTETDDDQDNSMAILYAHGIVMAAVFLIGYPVGSIMMPVLGNWLIHAGWQVFAFVGMWVGFALGYVLSSRIGTFFQDVHMQLGVMICTLMTVQPILGWLHHKHFLKYRRRGPVSHVHIWYGRGIMLLGIVNGGIGLQFAQAPTRFVLAYGIAAAVVSAMYLVCKGFGIFKRRRQQDGQHKLVSSPVELRNL